MPLYFLFPHSGHDYQRNLLNLIGNFFLLPVPPKPVIGIAWTLVAEVAFYIFFSFLILSRKTGSMIFVFWGFLIISRLFHCHSHIYFIDFISSITFLPFLLGNLIAILFMNGNSRFYIPCLFVGLAAFLGAGFALHDDFTVTGSTHSISILAYALSSALLIYGLVSLDGANRIRPPGLLVELGNATYSIYLFHWLVGWAFERAAVRTGLPHYLGIQSTFALLVVLMVGAGWIIYRLVERPSLVMFSRIWTAKFAPEARKPRRP